MMLAEIGVLASFVVVVASTSQLKDVALVVRSRLKDVAFVVRSRLWDVALVG